MAFALLRFGELVFAFCHSERSRGISHYFSDLNIKITARDVSTSLDMTKRTLKRLVFEVAFAFLRFRELVFT
jgi:hypothetical protein